MTLGTAKLPDPTERLHCMIKFDHLGILHREDWAREFLSTMSKNSGWAEDPPPAMCALRDWLGGTPAIVLSYPLSKLTGYDADAEVVETISALFPDAPVVSLPDLRGESIVRAVLVHPWPKHVQEIFRGSDCFVGRIVVVPWHPSDLISVWAEAFAELDFAKTDDTRDKGSGFAVIVEAMRTVELLEGHHTLGAGRGRELVAQVLQILRSAGHDLDPTTVAKAGFRAGLSYDNVEELTGHAMKFAAGHRFRVGKPQLRPDILRNWQDDSFASE